MTVAAGTTTTTPRRPATPHPPAAMHPTGRVKCARPRADDGVDALGRLLARVAFVPIPTAGGPGGGGGSAGGGRVCEACAGTHAGTYASGRFCSAPCAKKVGARRKWAAAPKARRAKRERGTCEACLKTHDRSYASGRFCSVHCARRVAAARKWDKSRTERSRRLDAIRPAPAGPVLLAVAPPSPCPCGSGSVVYGTHQHHPHHPPPPAHPPQTTGAPAHAPLAQAPPLFYANPVQWALLPHPMAFVPVAAGPMPEQPRPPLLQLARRPVSPPPQRPRELAPGAPLAPLRSPSRSPTLQLARTPVSPPASRPRSPSPPQAATAPVLSDRPCVLHPDLGSPEGAASEALLCLGVGDPSRSFGRSPVPAPRPPSARR